MNKNDIKFLAFYLPQFHPIPENDQWWGKGFTEWTNVTKAKPLYKGHYQPRLPSDLGFYDLRIPEVRQAQAEIAQKNGIHGFCYYHYWFGNSKVILEKPLSEVMKLKSPNFPFCLCWANESWEGRWYGVLEHKKKTLIEQLYPGVDDFVAHFQYLREMFLDDRYIKIDGKPLFQIYCPQLIPDFHILKKVFNEEAIKIGLPGIHFMGGQKSPIAHNLPLDSQISSSFSIAFENAKSFLYKTNSKLNSNKILFKLFKGKLNFSFGKVETYEYDKFIQIMNKTHEEDISSKLPTYPIVLNDFDNTARSGKKGVILKNSNPFKYEAHVDNAIKCINQQSIQNKFVFIKSWNEWAEGNYLESDNKWGYKYLDVIKKLYEKSISSC